MSTRRPFGFTVAVTAAVLALLSGALVAVNMVQGIRLDFSVPDTSRLVSSAHQTISLEANQQLEPLDESAVSITPAAPFSVATAANRLAISFESTLAYGTEYTVQVKGIVGSFSTTPRTETTTFTTPDAAVVVLRQSASGDSLVAVAIDPMGEDTVLFEAAEITDFAVSGDRVLVATADADLSKRLITVGLRDREVTEVELPGDGYASDLDSVPEYGLLGFRFDASVDASDFAFDRVLFVAEGEGTPRAMVALDGKPLQVFDWRFIPAKPALVAQDLGKDLLLVDLRPDRDLVPLGNYPDLLSVGRDGKSVVVGDALGMSRYDLTVGSVETISFDQPDGQIAYPSDAVWLADDRGVVRSFSVINPQTHLFEERVTLEVGGQTHTLFTSADSEASVIEVSTSPNDAYLLIETAVGEGESSTAVFDLAAGEEIARFVGSGAEWK